MTHGDGSFLNGTSHVVGDVTRERVRQNEKHPNTPSFPDGTGSIVDRIIAETKRRRCEDAFAVGECTWMHVLEEEVWEAFAESDPELLRKELVHVAAVAFRWVETIDAREDRIHHAP